MSNTVHTMTVKEAATALGVHPNTLYRAIADGQLQAIHIRRRVLISKTVVEAWLRSGIPAGSTT